MKLDDANNPIVLGWKNSHWIPHHPETWQGRYGELIEPVEFRVWNGHGANPEFTIRTIPAGTTVKIVMVSRFGDVGITDDLSVEYGYHARIDVRLIANLRN